jgi:hypothetical protein
MSNPPAINPATGRLRVCDVERLHLAVGGDPVTEELILRFIGDRWGAKNLFYLPPKVAAQILLRPADFIRAAKHYYEPELPF